MYSGTTSFFCLTLCISRRLRIAYLRAAGGMSGILRTGNRETAYGQGNSEMLTTLKNGRKEEKCRKSGRGSFGINAVHEPD